MSSTRAQDGAEPTPGGPEEPRTAPGGPEEPRTEKWGIVHDAHTTEEVEAKPGIPMKAGCETRDDAWNRASKESKPTMKAPPPEFIRQFGPVAQTATRNFAEAVALSASGTGPLADQSPPAGSPTSQPGFGKNRDGSARARGPAALAEPNDQQKPDDRDGSCRARAAAAGPWLTQGAAELNDQQLKPEDWKAEGWREVSCWKTPRLMAKEGTLLWLLHREHGWHQVRAGDDDTSHPNDRATSASSAPPSHRAPPATTSGDPTAAMP